MKQTHVYKTLKPLFVMSAAIAALSAASCDDGGTSTTYRITERPNSVTIEKNPNGDAARLIGEFLAGVAKVMFSN